MAGRKCKLSPEMEARIIEALRAGNFRQVAADYAGIAYSTLRDWMKQGRERPKTKFGQFRRRVLEAERQAEMRMVALVMKGAAEDPRHAQWYLERKFNGRWGRKEERRVDSKVEVRPSSAGVGRDLLMRIASLDAEQPELSH